MNKSVITSYVTVVIGAISYFGFGYAFAYGEPGNGFIGRNHFFGTNVAENATVVKNAAVVSYS